MGSVVERHVGRPETRDECTQSPDDYSDPPPTYEEFIRNVDTSVGSGSIPSDSEDKAAERESHGATSVNRVLERMNTV